MWRYLLTAVGGLVFAATFWIVFGSLAAMIGSRMPGGAREGAGAMGGFFFIGGLCGFAGLLIGTWIVWKVLADPARAGTVGVALIGTVAVLIIGTMFALRPTVVEPDDYPGQTAELAVEVSFPVPIVDSIAAGDRITYELRRGDGTEVTPWKRDQMRREAGRAVVPGIFKTRSRPRTELLAVMRNDEQLMCSTLSVDGDLAATTDWSAWQPLEAGLQARWRLIVTPATPLK